MFNSSCNDLVQVYRGDFQGEVLFVYERHLQHFLHLVIHTIIFLFYYVGKAFDLLWVIED